MRNWSVLHRSWMQRQDGQNAGSDLHEVATQCMLEMQVAARGRQEVSQHLRILWLLGLWAQVGHEGVAAVVVVSHVCSAGRLVWCRAASTSA